MREIKFRAFDKKENEMFYSSMYQDKTSMAYGLSNFLRECGDIEDTLMQYTGLKDKNGVEIYEGDVVKWGHLPNRTECWHRVAKVEMFPSLQFNILHYIDSKTLEKKKGNKHIFGFSNFIYKDTHNSLEVIVNIYENQELLKEINEKR